MIARRIWLWGFYDLSVKSLFSLLIICLGSDLVFIFIFSGIAIVFFYKMFRDFFHSFRCFKHYLWLHLPFISSCSLESLWISFISSLSDLFPSYWPLQLEGPSSSTSKETLGRTCVFLNTDTGLTVKLFSEKGFISICHTQGIYCCMPGIWKDEWLMSWTAK